MQHMDVVAGIFAICALVSAPAMDALVEWNQVIDHLIRMLM